MAVPNSSQTLDCCGPILAAAGASPIGDDYSAKDSLGWRPENVQLDSIGSHLRARSARNVTPFRARMCRLTIKSYLMDKGPPNYWPGATSLVLILTPINGRPGDWRLFQGSCFLFQHAGQDQTH